MNYALITGGTKGIGKAIGKMLLEKGYSIILNYASDNKNANEVLNEFSIKYSGKVFLIKADLSSTNTIDSIYQNLLKITSKLDVLVLNAGMTDRTNFIEIKEDIWDQVIKTNITVPFFLIQKFIKIMPINSSIVFTGSLMGIIPHSLSLSYGVTKAAVHSLVKNLVKYLSPLKIRVNALAPGFVETAWQTKKSPEIKHRIENKIGLKRFGSPEEVADACWFLIQNNYMNGEILVIDGGYNFE